MNPTYWLFAVLGASVLLASAAYCATAIYRVIDQQRQHRQIMDRFGAV